MTDSLAQVLVISDPNATKSAAAMSVDVGAASDPDGLPGLAHFLEHMLFLGEGETVPCPSPAPPRRMI